MEFKYRLIEYSEEVKNFIRKQHYTQTCPLFVEYVFGLFTPPAELVGVATFSGFSRQQVKWRYPGYIELSRLVLRDECPKNSESFFLGGCLRWLRDNTQLVGVLTYADTTEGHFGIIYRACNFKEAGQTQASYHYLLGNERLHKRNIWRQAQKLGITEKALARRLGLIKVKEDSKYRFIYPFRESLTDEVHGEVYLITNTINDTVYVGSTINGAEYRFNRHLADARNGSPLFFHTAIRALGAENFSVRTIDTATTRLMLHNREAFHIAQYKNKPGGVYNTTEGYDVDSYMIPDAVFMRTFDMRAAGQTVESIAQELRINSDYIGKVHSGTIRPHLRAKWSEKNKFDFYRFFSESDKMEIFRAHSKGVPVADIAKKFKTSRTYVRSILKGKISPEALAAWAETNSKPEIKNPRLKDRDLIRQVYHRVFIQKELPKQVAEDLHILEIYPILLGQVYSNWFREWKAEGHPVKYVKGQVYTDAELWPIFEARASGEQIKDIAVRLNIARGIVNQVLLGKQRPHLLKRWIKEGGKPLTQRTLGKEVSNKIQIQSSEDLTFSSIAEAAKHYGVSSQAIIKGMRNNKPVKGVRFRR